MLYFLKLEIDFISLHSHLVFKLIFETLKLLEHSTVYLSCFQYFSICLSSDAKPKQQNVVLFYSFKLTFITLHSHLVFKLMFETFASKVNE